MRLRITATVLAVAALTTATALPAAACHDNGRPVVVSASADCGLAVTAKVKRDRLKVFTVDNQTGLGSARVNVLDADNGSLLDGALSAPAGETVFRKARLRDAAAIVADIPGTGCRVWLDLP